MPDLRNNGGEPRPQAVRGTPRRDAPDGHGSLSQVFLQESAGEVPRAQSHRPPLSLGRVAGAVLHLSFSCVISKGRSATLAVFFKLCMGRVAHDLCTRPVFFVVVLCSLSVGRTVCHGDSFLFLSLSPFMNHESK